MEEDLILGDPDERDDLDTIETQLVVINSVLDVDPVIYDAFEEDRVKVIALAMKIIQKIQRKILKEIP